MTSSTSSIADVLKTTAIFSALSDSELGSLATRTLIRSYAPDELLFSEGTSCEDLYILSKGQVRIFKTPPAGREQVLAIEGPGSSIAELPVFDGGRRMLADHDDAIACLIPRAPPIGPFITG